MEITMKTMFRAAAAAAMILSLGVVANAQSRHAAHRSAAAAEPSVSQTVMGLSVPR